MTGGPDNILIFSGITRHDMPPAVMLDNVPRDLASVLVLGWTAEGELFFSSSMSDGGNCLWLMEKAKRKLMEITEEDIA